MGAFLSLDEAHRILTIRFEGIVTDDVLLHRYQQVRQWVAVHGYFPSISDFSDVASFEVTPVGVRELAAQSPLVPDGFLRVVVAPQDEVYGMTRMFEILGSETRNSVYVFHSLAEAYQLMGVESLNPSPIINWE
jgi:hypothetical protein